MNALRRKCLSHEIATDNNARSCVAEVIGPEPARFNTTFLPSFRRAMHELLFIQAQKPHSIIEKDVSPLLVC